MTHTDMAAAIHRTAMAQSIGRKKAVSDRLDALRLLAHDISSNLPSDEREAFIKSCGVT